MNYGVATADGGMLAHKGETMNEFQQQLATRMRESIGNRVADIRAKVEAFDRFHVLSSEDLSDIEWMLGILEGLCEQSTRAALGGEPTS